MSFIFALLVVLDASLKQMNIVPSTVFAKTRHIMDCESPSRITRHREKGHFGRTYRLKTTPPFGVVYFRGTKLRRKVLKSELFRNIIVSSIHHLQTCFLRHTV